MIGMTDEAAPHPYLNVTGNLTARAESQNKLFACTANRRMQDAPYLM